MNLAENERSKIITILILFYGKKKKEKKECSDYGKYSRVHTLNHFLQLPPFALQT